jgi:hypothetical protein
MVATARGVQQHLLAGLANANERLHLGRVGKQVVLIVLRSAFRLLGRMHRSGRIQGTCTPYIIAFIV